VNVVVTASKRPNLVA